jgi:hypothetical protein
MIGRVEADPTRAKIGRVVDPAVDVPPAIYLGIVESPSQ